MRVLSSTSLLIAAVTLAARSCSIGTVLFQAAKAHRMARGMRPGHHFLLHLKTLCIRYLAGSGNTDKTNAWYAVNLEMRARARKREWSLDNRLFSDLQLASHAARPEN